MLIPQLFCHAECGIAPECFWSFSVSRIDMNWPCGELNPPEIGKFCIEDSCFLLGDWELRLTVLLLSKVIIFWISVFSKLIFIVLWDRFNEIPECDCCSSRCCRCCRRCFYYCFLDSLWIFFPMDYPWLVTRNGKNPRWWFLPKWLYRVAPQYSPVTI
jgi:hypothetical protein